MCYVWMNHIVFWVYTNVNYELTCGYLHILKYIESYVIESDISNMFE
jgi:hypothetical protein